MAKEEILKDNLNNTNWNYLDHVMNSGRSYPDILNAMQQYADEQTLAFANWKDTLFHDIRKECFDYYKSTDSYVIKSNAELLQIFKNENK